jgi:pimeloyl-ACP methyl ester carboxylesterase
MLSGVKRLRGIKALVHDAVDKTTELVDEGHESTARTVKRVLSVVPELERPAELVDGLRRVSTRSVLGTIRFVNRAVEALTDAGLDLAAERARARGDVAEQKTPMPLRSDVVGSRAWLADAALGLLNGAVGDTLHASKNGLDLGFELRAVDTGPLPLDRDDARASLITLLCEPRARVVVFVHGLMTTEWSWWLESQAYHGDPSASFGTLLARDLGVSSLWARYNSGRHVSENGRLLARALAALVAAWPVELDELVLVGHSMGGLVIRSACHYADVEGLGWPRLVRRVVSLGSPHHGAPLERVGKLATALLGSIDTPGTRIPARLLEGRSAGIKDLGAGKLVDEDWLGRDEDAVADDTARRVPLLPHVTYCFVSATITRDPEHPVGRLVGDLLVRVPSASGARLEASTFPIETRLYGGVAHHELQNHPAVYEVLRDLCAAPPGSGLNTQNP